MKTYEYQYYINIPGKCEKEERLEIEKRIADTGMRLEYSFGFSLVTVPLEAEDEDEYLERSARLIFATFGDVCDPELDELPYPRSAFRLIKYYDKQERKPANEQGYIQALGTGYCNVFFTLIAHSPLENPQKAAQDCNEQVEAIITGQDMTARMDIPPYPGQLKMSNKDVYFTHYTIGVRVKENPDQFMMVEAAALRLWERVKACKVHVEMDDMNGTLLEALVKYFIPKRRKGASGLGL